MVAVVGGPGSGEVRWNAELLAGVGGDDVGGGGMRPFSQHSLNAASQCAPNRTINEHGRRAS